MDRADQKPPAGNTMELWRNVAREIEATAMAVKEWLAAVERAETRDKESK